MSPALLAVATNQPQKQGPLLTLKRTISSAQTPSVAPVRLDQDSDQWTEADWPNSQPFSIPTVQLPALNVQKQASASAARSQTHWKAMAEVRKQEMHCHQAPVKREYPWDVIDGQAEKRQRQNSACHRLATPGVLPAAVNKNVNKQVRSSTANIRQRVVLSLEQQEVLRLVVDEGKSVFFTGSAGTGKSVLLREIIASLRTKFLKKPDAVAVTASTGMAACNVGGSTIHSFAGIGLGIDNVDTLVARIKNPKNKKAADRWRRTLVLVIDEVSMVDGGLFDKLEAIARQIRKKTDQPFGGIQLVVTGDFFQLPPVAKNAHAVKYAFEARTWKEAIEVTVALTQVFRQKDTVFVDMLNELRFGQLSAKSTERFVALRRPVEYDDGIDPTQLCALRNEVDKANNERLVRIKLPVRDFLALDSGEGLDEDQRDRLLDNLMAPKKLSLKPGAQVMYLKNSPELGLVNGTLGKVMRFAPPSYRVQDDEEDDIGSNDEATAAVKHEECDVIKLASLAKKGSRAKFEKSDRDVPWIEWNINGKPVMPVSLDEFKIEQNGVVKAKRIQFPLMLAWAVSIHKSQGQTLDRVRVDLRRIFEAGQAYVALSRATSMHRLEVTGFDPSKVTVNRKVVEWNRGLTVLSVPPS